MTGSGTAAAGTRRARSRPQRVGPPKGSDQRARLLQAIVSVVAEHGYGAAKIGEIADRASVSRATFYELFEDKEACFAEAHSVLAQRIGAEIDAAIRRAEPADAGGAAIRAITTIAKREPDPAAFLTHHALLAGPRPRDSHDRMMSHLERSVEEAWERSHPADAAPEVPARVLLGGARGCCA